LADSPFAEGIVLFNGSNTDDRSKVIYSAWLQRHKGTDRVTGSRTADMRSALVDYFHEEGRIMIATEAGAEGINLQFCSLVVNYDLPWNPQRIEQRIGRCHRYGQKHDVVVVNFLNRNNAADRRVFELLSEKFQLFEGVFGASDEVLGAIESGVDFEKRIADIYQRCRQPEQIKTAFDQLQLELSLEIDEAMTSTRRKLLENFDDDVRDKLRIRDEASRANLNRFERWLMQVTEHELGRHAEFLSDSAFRLLSNPFAPLNGDIPLGLYELPRRTGEAHLYRLNHPLAESVVIQARTRDLPPATIRFNYNGRIGKSSLLEPIVGSSGWLSLSLLSVEALDQAEDHLIFAGITDLGIALDQETVSRLFGLPGNVEASLEPPEAMTGTLKGQTDERQSSIQKEITERNLSFFAAEADKLDGWADDLKLGLEREIKELEREIKEARRAAISALTLQDKLGVQKQIRALESQRNDKRRALFDAQDAVDKQRDTLIAQIEGKLTQHMDQTNLFLIRWTLA
jgi:adenine-specific DNA-methyltransferase